MKKIIIGMVGVFLLLLFNYVYATPVSHTIIDAVQLDDDPTSTTGTYNVSDFKKVAFFVDYDETEVGNSVSAAVTMHFSYDNTNWVSGYFYDLAGGTSLQTSETLSSDGWYYCWLDPNWQIPYVRVTITATNTDSDDLAVVTTYLIGTK